jgi:hypothetical protein
VIVASWPQVLRALTKGEDLHPDEAAWAMNSILEGTATEAQIGGFAMALRAKGESASEVESFVAVMLDHAKRVDHDFIALDVVGTGGDSITLNDKGVEVGVAGGVLTATLTDTSLAGTFLEALDLASAGNGGTNAIVTWFQYSGNTYLVQDMGASVTYDVATDIVIKITGTVDLLAGTDLAITFG